MQASCVSENVYLSDIYIYIYIYISQNVYLRNQEVETVINNHLGPADLETPLLLWEL